MKPNTSARRAPLTQASDSREDASRGRILIVEPDPLTQWSLKTYLEKWFRVDITDSIARAQKVLDTRAVDALVVSEELSPADLAALERRAHRSNARVGIVRTVTDSSKPCRPGQHQGCLEKPFALARLARLLGIPEDELPRES